MIAFALTLNVAVFVLVAGLLACRGFLSIYSGLFCYTAFHYLVFVQRPLLVWLFDLRSEFLFMGYVPTDDVWLRTLFVVNLGYLSFVLAYLWAVRWTAWKPTFSMQAVTPGQRKSLVLALFLLLPLIVYSLFIAFTMRQAYGTKVLEQLGEINMTIDPETGSPLFVDTSAYVIFGRNMILPFASIFVLAARGRWWSFIPLALCCFAAIQLGERWPFVIAGFVTVLLLLYIRGRSQLRITHYLGILAVLVLFVAIGQNRGAVLETIRGGDVAIDFDFRSSSFGEHPDFANFDFLTFVVAKVPDVSGTWSYFTQYAGIITQPIPRVFWPGKPVGSPIVLVNLNAYGRFATRTPSLVGDGWTSLGYPGVVITLGLVGALYGWLYRRFCERPPSLFFLTVNFWMVALLLQWARDGGYRIADFCLFCLGPVLLAYLLNRIYERDAPALAGPAGLKGTDLAGRSSGSHG